MPSLPTIFWFRKCPLTSITCVPCSTGGGKKENPEEDVQTGPLYLQGHGNPVFYRNVWIGNNAAVIYVTGVLPNGMRIAVPNSKMKWDQGNPTGHGIIFIGAAGALYCYVAPGGV